MSNQQQLSYLDAHLMSSSGPGMVETWPLKEQPTSRLLYVGAPNLSQVELLAILVGGSRQIEAAQLLTQRFGTDLPHALSDELTVIPGVGESTAARILAAVELGKRFASVSSADRPQIKSPSDAHTLLLPLIGDAERECFVVLYLNTRNQVTEHEILYRGTLNTSLVNTGEVFRGAIRRHCAAIIVGHNHPSGDPSPSPEDVALTKRLVDAGKLLDVELLDHLVVARGRYVSLRERGLGFSA